VSKHYIMATTTPLPHNPPQYATPGDTDSNILAMLGKKQVLKRRFGLVSIFGFAMCELITWETVLALFSQGLDNGGKSL
jgi:hypothetical protein